MARKRKMEIDITAKDKTKKATDSANKNLKSLGVSVGKLTGLLAGLGAGLALAKIARDFVAINKEFQRLNASLVTVTGSTEAANAAFKNIEDFAKKTPYQLSQVVDSFIKLKAMGLDPSNAALMSYGNTASAMGKELNQMIEAVADAATGEFERLKEFGIKASSQGDKVTFLFRGISTTVKKEASAIEGYLRKIGEVEFAGGMARQMDTLGGALSNLEDSYDSLFRKMAEEGAADNLTSSIKGLSDALNDPNLIAGMTALANAGAQVALIFADALALYGKWVGGGSAAGAGPMAQQGMPMMRSGSAFARGGLFIEEQPAMMPSHGVVQPETTSKITKKVVSPVISPAITTPSVGEYNLDAYTDALSAFNNAFAKSLKKTEVEVEEHVEVIETEVEELSQFTIQAYRSMQDSVSDVLYDMFEGQLKSTEDYAKAFSQVINKMVADYLSQMLLMKATGQDGGVGIGGLLSSGLGYVGGLFSGGVSGANSQTAWESLGRGVDGYRAVGGSVLSGKNYVVGEKGPEVLSLGASGGYITPNNKLGMSVTIPITINDPVSSAYQAGLRSQIEQTVEQYVRSHS